MKRSHTASGRKGGSDEGGDGSGGGGGGGRVHHRHAKEKVLGLGDISSDSGSEVSDDKPAESDDESPRHRVGQVWIC